MQINVETHSGYKADKYQKKIWIGALCFEVLDIEDRWYGPGCSYFKVFADNSRTYIVKHDQNTDIWKIE